MRAFAVLGERDEAPRRWDRGACKGGSIPDQTGKQIRGRGREDERDRSEECRDAGPGNDPRRHVQRGRAERVSGRGDDAIRSGNVVDELAEECDERR